MSETDVKKLSAELYECITMLEVQLSAIDAICLIKDPFAHMKISHDFLSASFALHQQLIEKIDDVCFSLGGGE